MADPFEGSTIAGRYRIRHILGVGGSASIYEAEDLTFGRTVALKIPHGNAGSKTIAAKRLIREARASGAVGHPNVCEISEIGALPGGTPFIVMERLVGETLRDRITNVGRLPFGDIVDVMMQVLSGLTAAHDRGIIHRDVKPENIFLSRRSGCPALVKILDFGLVATDEAERESLTAAGRVVGTPHYLAPEQIRGTRDFDPAVDLYACGVVLYEATTGRRPFTSANIAELFREILAASPPDVVDLRRDTPPLLAAVISRAMAVAASNRFANAAAFQAALSKVQAGPPTPASLGAFRAAAAVRLSEGRSPTGPQEAAGHGHAPTTGARHGSGPYASPMRPPTAPPAPPVPHGSHAPHGSHPPHAQQGMPPIPPLPPGPDAGDTTFNMAMAKVTALEETRIEGRYEDKSIEIEFSKEEDVEGDPSTDWDQPTIKNPVPKPGPRK